MRLISGSTGPLATLPTTTRAQGLSGRNLRNCGQIALTWPQLATGRTTLGETGPRFELADTVCRIAACPGHGQPATLGHSPDAVWRIRARLADRGRALYLGMMTLGCCACVANCRSRTCWSCREQATRWGGLCTRCRRSPTAAWDVRGPCRRQVVLDIQSRSGVPSREEPPASALAQTGARGQRCTYEIGRSVSRIHGII